MDEFRAFLRLLKPHNVANYKKIRVGSDADGGYVMLDDLRPVRNAISLGIGDEISWDKQMADYGIRIFQYDEKYSPWTHKNVSFDCKRVVGSIAAVDEISFAQIMDDKELEGDNDIIAKIDIEGGEWNILSETTPDVLARVRQFLIEFHWIQNFTDEVWRGAASYALWKLMLTHCCIHIHGNNWDSIAVIDGIPFPNVFEATFVRRADYDVVPDMRSFPTDLDRPCNPDSLDYYLGRWNY